MTYEQALAYIASLQPRGWRLGLDRMNEFVTRASLTDFVGSDRGPQFIHVAGTNGKGSTTAFIQSILVESGYKTGAFFSPFVVDPRERIQLGRDFISKDDLAELTDYLIPIAEQFTETEFGGITEFEFKTALGFEYWRIKGCEWVALEVGLGGRLDATNVVTPKASVIVSIGLDHVAILGDTHAKIAHEKAGVIKPGVPLIVGELPDEAEQVIVREANELGAPIWRWGREIVWREDERAVVTPLGIRRDLIPGLVGAAQQHNMALAIAAVDAAGAFRSEHSDQAGVARASLPGRFHRVKYKDRTIVLDGAHNSESATVLVKSLQTAYPAKEFVLVTNMLAGHEPAEFYGKLRGLVKAAIVVPVDFHRATHPTDMAETLIPIFADVRTAESPSQGLDEAVKQTLAGDIILVTGTFYLVGELLRHLERNQLAKN